MHLGGLTFVENGYLNVTGATLGGSNVSTGLNSSYTLYLQFHLTGGTSSLALPGTIDSGTLTLYGVSGVSTFGFDGGNNASVNNGGNLPVALFSSTIINGTIAATPQLDLSATALGTVNPIQAGFISGPNVPLFMDLVAAHDNSTITPLNGGAVFLVNGGPDTLTFAVPEPSTLSLVGLGLATAVFLRRRSR